MIVIYITYKCLLSLSQSRTLTEKIRNTGVKNTTQTVELKITLFWTARIIFLEFEFTYIVNEILPLKIILWIQKLNIKFLLS